MRFDYRILGPVEVLRDGEPVRLGGRKQRTLLALLALQPGEPVAADGLIEALWPRYDEAARSRLQVNVSQLRSALGDPVAIGHGPGGYTLAAEPESVDAVRFEAAAREGRAALAAGDPERAERALREALAMWRGPALGDLAYEPFAQAAVRGLEELRLGALEDRIEADLALGRHRELVAELEPLVAEQPVRERLRGALMLALYRCGRQADALDAYLAARRTLVEELGVEPGPELRRLHAAILEQDATLLVDPAEVRARRHLPAPATALVGRRAQLADLDALLRRDGVRLVTLTGVGGSGKTRLALAVAGGLADRFEHGVYFAALAPEKDPGLVPDAIAAALGVDERPGEPIAATLASYLRDRRLLLVTDNFEHVDEAAPVVSELLAAAPGLKVLATSRSPLRLYGEHEYPVPPLDDADAVDLFVVRARAARHAFQLGAADAAAVVEICARLDGLPLAIELAAARSRTLAPSEMVAALPRLELAAEGPRDVPERQRTLRATLDWSHALLTSRERELFAGLGVFVGGCDAEAAFAVCGAGEPELELLAEESLLEHSGERFAMLETVREYALERLGDSGLSDDLSARHAEHYAALAELAEPELTADRRGSWLLRLETEHPNFRAALTWCARTGAIALELRLVAALTRFWVVRGHLREGRAWIESALDRSGDAPPELRAKGLAAGASVTFWQGDYEGLKAFAREGIALCEQVGDKRGMAQALDRLGTAIANEGDHAGSMELYERSLALCREIDDVRMLAISTTNVGCLAMMQGDYERAELLSREGLELHERAGQRDGMQQPLFNLGLIALLTGRADEALAIFDDGLAQAEELGFRAGTFYVMEGQAAAYAARGEHERAAAKLGAAAAAAERAGGAQLEPFEQEIHDRTVASLRAALGDAAYEAAFAAEAVVTPR